MCTIIKCAGTEGQCSAQQGHTPNKDQVSAVEGGVRRYVGLMEAHVCTHSHHLCYGETVVELRTGL